MFSVPESPSLKNCYYKRQLQRRNEWLRKIGKEGCNEKKKLRICFNHFLSGNTCKECCNLFDTLTKDWCIPLISHQQVSLQVSLITTALIGSPHKTWARKIILPRLKSILLSKRSQVKSLMRSRLFRFSWKRPVTPHLLRKQIPVTSVLIGLIVISRLLCVFKYYSSFIYCNFSWFAGLNINQ